MPQLETKWRARHMQRWATCTDEQPKEWITMKVFTVTAFFSNGQRDWFQSTDLAIARAKFNEWRNHWLSVHVVIE